MDPISLIGLLGGAITRFFPTVLDFFKQGRDLKYEVTRLAHEVELEKLRGINAQNEIVMRSEATTDTSWAAGLAEALKGQTVISGDKWLDRINVSVRPILTYWWCIFMYSFSKLITAAIAFQEATPLKDAFPLLITEFDRGVIASIIGFWFVDRALRNSRMK